MLPTLDSEGDILRALRAGASAYILKSIPKNELLGVIRSVHAGRRHIPADVAARLAEHLGDDDLTTRELEVIRLIQDGYRNKQIADQLAICETTVNFHIKNLVDKLQANDRTHGHHRAPARHAANLTVLLRPYYVGSAECWPSHFSPCLFAHLLHALPATPRLRTPDVYSFVTMECNFEISYLLSRQTREGVVWIGKNWGAPLD
jgi:DNA-binding CsgD family transcriptional regulator